MISTSATKFYKQATCPASEKLLSYHACALTEEQCRRITVHLAACDFCSAELQLLIEHPPCEASEMLLEDAKMPLSLRRLAEALLAGNTLDATMVFFTGTSYEKAPLTLTDA